MKTILFFVAFVALSAATFAQSIPNAKSLSFKVWGNCGSCKKTIEKAVNQPNLVSANWNKSTKIIAVTFDSTQTSVAQIQKKIAEAGYDNEGVTASDDAYSNLHSCCQYDRKKK
ncbi:MAG: cation transporter [Candidatus Kapaibacterium sp.]